MDSENQTQVITKQKSEGRVRAGKQLAEWNKKNKENLIKNKTQDNPSEKSSNLSSAEKASSYLSSNHYYGGAGIALVAGVVLFYFWNQKPEKTLPSVPPTKPKISDEEFYRMN